MDSQQIRLKNLRFLIDTDFDGRSANLARAMDVAPNNISRYFSSGPHRRNISDTTARQIEKAVKKDNGWLDTPQWKSKDDLVSRVIEEVASFSDAETKELLFAIDLIKARRDR